MRKFYLFCMFVMLVQLSGAQVFNSASTLKPGNFAIGLEPVFYDRANNLGLFFHGGAGIKNGIDMSVKLGLLEGVNYFGGDFEWSLLSGNPSVSLVTGAHVWYDFGLDLGLNISFPLRNDVQIYTGFDSDIDFSEPETVFRLWLPIGLELKLNPNVAIIMEGEIPLTDYAFGIFGGGIAFYF